MTCVFNALLDKRAAFVNPTARSGLLEFVVEPRNIVVHEPSWFGSLERCSCGERTSG